MWRTSDHEFVRKYCKIGTEDTPTIKDLLTIIKYYIEKTH